MDQVTNRRHRPLKVVVRVYEADTDVQIRERRVDIANSNQKDWVYDLILWATLNGKVVEVVNERDDL
jgi:hypothetical protein